MTVNDLIKLSLRTLRVLAPDETPTATELADALIVLNNMVDLWTAERCFIYETTRSVQNLVASQGSYTIGSGGNFNITRPINVTSAGIIIDPSIANPLEVPMEVLRHSDEYAAIVNQTLVSTYPRKIYYNPSYPLGIIYLWPIPASSLPDLVLYVWTQLSAFATGTSTIALPPGYALALQYNLAVLLADEYGVNPSQLTVDKADKFKEIVKTVNLPMSIPILTTDYPVMERGRFNIILGDWKQ
jgi:hypothetical protein